MYRRYRPENFSEVIGQDHVTVPLRNALSNNRVNHAYLFSGPRGCGKTTSARILARAINCEKGPIAEPCGVCKSCTDLARGGPGSIDVIEIDAASHGGVDDARDLRERAFFSPVESRYKIYIIDEAHMVTTQGFNALLKLVEEPPPHLKFIFATTEPEKVIGTIRSRTHHYPFRLVPPKALADYMATLCEAEAVTIESAALPLVVRAGAGSVRDSLSVLDQLIGGADAEGVTYRLAVQLLGFTPDSLLDACVDGFAAHDSKTVFETIEKVIETGQDPKRFAEDLLRRLRDLVILSAVPNAVASGLIEASEDQGQRLQTQAAGIGPAELTRAADIVAAGLLEMRGATAPRLQLELICAKVLLPGADDSTNGIQARLDRMERRLTITGGVGTAPAGPPGTTNAGAYAPASTSNAGAYTPAAGTAPAGAPPSPPEASGPAPAQAQGQPQVQGQLQGAGQPQRSGEPQASGQSHGAGQSGASDQSQGAASNPAAGQGQGEVPGQTQLSVQAQPDEGAQVQDPGAPRSAAPANAQGQDRAASQSAPSQQAGSQPAATQAVAAASTAVPAQAAAVDNSGSRSGAWGDEPAAGAVQGGWNSQTAPGGAAGAPAGSAPATNAPTAGGPAGSPAGTNAAVGGSAGGVAAQSAPGRGPAVAGTSSGSMGLIDVRRLWPEILEAVKAKRRFAWIMLSQNAQVIAIDEQTLTLGLVNAGARESFARSGSDEILREAMVATIGIDRRVEAVVDPSSDPSATAPAAPGGARPLASPPPSAPPASSWDAQPPSAPPSTGTAPANPGNAQPSSGKAGNGPTSDGNSPSSGSNAPTGNAQTGNDNASPGNAPTGNGNAPTGDGTGAPTSNAPTGDGMGAPTGNAQPSGQTGNYSAPGVANASAGGDTGGGAVATAVREPETTPGGQAVVVQETAAVTQQADQTGQTGMQSDQQAGGPPAPAANPEQGTQDRPEQTASKRRAAEAAVAAEQSLRAAQVQVDEAPLTPEEEAEAVAEDDVILEEDSRSHTDLLSETLGAQIISEEPN
nr:DNA polymerase III subunit gamma and tau [Streptomyces sp. SID13031]